MAPVHGNCLVLYRLICPGLLWLPCLLHPWTLQDHRHCGEFAVISLGERGAGEGRRGIGEKKQTKKKKILSLIGKFNFCG